jgi:caffeoyl-CoA O-methyltransferase
MRYLCSVEWINDLANQYAERFTDAEDPLLAELDTHTRAYHPEPHMLSGRLQGRLLAMLSRLLKPRYILEIGTLTGYSALCLAEGLTEDGELHTLEIRERDADIARNFIRRSRFAEQITVHTGSAPELLESLHLPWDMVFIDADKVNYVSYLNAVIGDVKPGGLILADNVLFHGQVLEQDIRGKNAKAVHAFNEWVKQDDRIESCLLTVRDGLMMIRKK